MRGRQGRLLGAVRTLRPTGSTRPITARPARGPVRARRTLGVLSTRSANWTFRARRALGVFAAGPTSWTLASRVFAARLIATRRACRSLARVPGAFSGFSSSTRTLRALTSSTVATIGVSLLAVTPSAPTFGGVRDDDVGALFRLGNEFEAFVSGIERGGGLGRHDGEDFNTFHVLLDVGAIDVANDWPTGDERRLKDALG